MRLATQLKLPSETTLNVRSLYHVVIVVDEQQLVDDDLVVRNVRVVQRIDVAEDVGDFLNAPCGSYPQLALRVLEAFRLDILDLHDSVVALLSPLQFLI